MRALAFFYSRALRRRYRSFATADWLWQSVHRPAPLCDSSKVQYRGFLDVTVVLVRGAFATVIMLASFPKVPKTYHVASKSHENQRFRLPQCRLTLPLQRIPIPANIRTNFMSPETRVNGVHFLLLIVWVYLHSIFCAGLRKTHLIWTRMRIGRSRLRSSKVVDFGTNRKGVCDFLLVINSKFGPILHRF